MPESFPVVDTHTGGEITRVLLADDIGLSGNSAKDHLERLRSDLDWIRRSLTSEPRGSEYAVGAVVAPPSTDAGGDGTGSVVFFNNVDYLGMCGHGLIGIAAALRHRRLITDGIYPFDTPAGIVTASISDNGQVCFEGVASYCFRRDVPVPCDDGTTVVGDIAYGGNWFFIARDESVASATATELMEKTKRIRRALDDNHIRGDQDALIDHVELFCPLSPDDDLSASEGGCRNFVLCPGGHYDRSPCGTGTSAKIACLAARGELEPGDEWIQQSFTGSRFYATYRNDGEHVRVKVTGRAHVTAETIQIYDPDDGLRFGIGDAS